MNNVVAEEVGLVFSRALLYKGRLDGATKEALLPLGAPPPGGDNVRTKVPSGSPPDQRPSPPMENGDGSDRDNETFKYDLCTKFDFGPGVPNAILIFDPGGDNQGPPQSPSDLE